jgi:heat shock protein HslJ
LIQEVALPTRLPALLIPAAFALLALPAPGFGQDMRSLTGSVTVLERMALPDDTVLVVDLTDGTDSRITEFREQTEGRQSPFAFSIDMPADVPAMLRAGLRGAVEIMWLSEPVAIPAGSDPVDLGALRALRLPHMGFASILTCGTQVVEIGSIPDGLRLRFNEQVVTLAPQPAASGALYVDPDNPATQIHMKEDAALLRIDGAELAECQLVQPETSLTVGVWNISAILDKPAIFPSRTELVFFPDGRVVASVGCNRMIGSYRRHGGILTFGAIASTRMGCPDGLGEQEEAFMAALVRVDGFVLNADATRLTLTAAGQTVIRAQR